MNIHETQDRETCYALRHQVFVQEQGYSAEGEIDELDPVSIHLLAEQDGTPIGTARVFIKEDTAKIGRVCVLRSGRGTGLGARLIQAAVQVARQNKMARVVLGAQAHAVGFYEKLGFRAFAEPYLDEGEPHQMMEKNL
ncbi:GNAT family N-acetyltransferase [Sulfitobacter donghicola]|uniref:Acetyltransferase n=1 Tax=Sulfitobacter donghicola DSW-25 = KCTC 12864 = JCM 14565 TaxID=1300350 RepID=A0A073ILH7_9RHOB|nr:GNAT family N-acetyltransferase [Sulfitobacter donghicola]KEJ90579.1 acetyltransferase [Sulfitobacter donghicola DSW-25 = KCTC 12864 = JCM 14565]